MYHCRLTSRQRRPLRSRQRRKSWSDSSRNWKDFLMFSGYSAYWKILELKTYVLTFVLANMAQWWVQFCTTYTCTVQNYLYMFHSAYSAFCISCIFFDCSVNSCIFLKNVLYFIYWHGKLSQCHSAILFTYCRNVHVSLFSVSFIFMQSYYER